MDDKEGSEDVPPLLFEWNPDSASSVDFLGILPLSQQDRYEQHDAPGKLKTSNTHRKQRRRLYATGSQQAHNEHDSKKLIHAVEKGETTCVRDLLEAGVDPSTDDDKARTPLHIAAARGDEQLVTMLLDHGADPNKKDLIYNTPLHLAACTNQIKVVTLLLRAGAEVNALDNTGHTPLHLATGRLRMLKSRTSYTNTQLKSEVCNIIDMMREYLVKKQSGADMTQLDDFQEQLNETSSRNGIDDISDLLSNFAGLQLTKKDHPG